MYGELISAVTVGAGGASNITFSAIPGTFTDVIVVYSGIDIGINIVLNSSTSGYSYRTLYGYGNSTGSTSASSVSQFGGIFNYWGGDSGINAQAYFPNYAGSTNKTVSAESVSERNATNAVQQLYAGTWANTAAITSIKLDGGGATIPQHTTAYLYGLTKGSGGATVS